MNGKDFGEVVSIIVKNDDRYDKGAYEFVRQALDHTLRKIQQRREQRANPHVSGAELLMGVREYALEQYGPMAFALFDQWGIHETADFGEIVFNLVDYGVFGKTETDSREDFDSVYDFREAFVEPFLPPSRRSNAGKEQ